MEASVGARLHRSKTAPSPVMFTACKRRSASVSTNEAGTQRPE